MRCGSLRQGKAVAARMLWVGLDVVRQEVCIGVERFGEVWSHPVRQEFAKVRRGRDACGMFRQSRNGPDIFGGAG